MTTISPIKYEVEIHEPLSTPVPMPPSMLSSEALVIWMFRIAMNEPIMAASTAIQVVALARSDGAGEAGSADVETDGLGLDMARRSLSKLRNLSSRPRPGGPAPWRESRWLGSRTCRDAASQLKNWCRVRSSRECAAPPW